MAKGRDLGPQARGWVPRVLPATVMSRTEPYSRAFLTDS